MKAHEHSPARRPRIGIFDSGVGGLTVLRAIAALLPGADYFYFGDTARLPYGTKSQETVARYAIQAAQFLVEQEIDMLVIGCNTASALALYDIKGAVSVPVIGVIEPGADTAAAISTSREAVVFATEATVASHAYQKALQKLGIDSREKACPLFVPLVEEGWAEHSVTDQVARIYLDEAFAGNFRDADVLVLGCTHYPLLRPVLQRLEPGVKIVDSAESTARAVAEQLGPHAGEAAQPGMRFMVTDSVEKFRRLGERFLGREISAVEHVDLKE